MFDRSSFPAPEGHHLSESEEQTVYSAWSVHGAWFVYFAEPQADSSALAVPGVNSHPDKHQSGTYRQGPPPQPPHRAEFIAPDPDLPTCVAGFPPHASPWEPTPQTPARPTSSDRPRAKSP